MPSTHYKVTESEQKAFAEALRNEPIAKALLESLERRKKELQEAVKKQAIAALIDPTPQVRTAGLEYFGRLAEVSDQIEFITRYLEE